MSIDYRQFPILCVDDDRASLVAMCYALEEQFCVITASTGEEALKKLIVHDVAVLLADQKMPGMDGVTLCERAREVKPHVVRIMVTAYADLEKAVEAINRGQVARYLRKPWTEEELRATLRTAIDVVHLQRLMADVEIRLLRGEEAALTVTRTLAHEVGQQLTMLALTMEKARRMAASVNDPALQAQLSEVARSGEAQVDHLTELLRRATQIAEGNAAQQGVADASRVVEMGMSIVRPELGRRARTEVIVEGHPKVGLSATELAQVLVNILANACRALPEGEAHKNLVSVHLTTELGFAVFTIRDSGCGIPPEILPRIYEDGFTTRPDPKGAGRGLHIVKEIVRRHSGHIIAESMPGKTTFVVKLPLARD